jgi:tetratricopeptide (TPR) repeat protein
MSKRKKSRRKTLRPESSILRREGAGLTDFFLGLLLVAITTAAYQTVWHAGFIWDDDVYVTANPLLTAPDGLKRIWFSLDSPSQYFPLVYTTFRLEYALWGLNAAGYHWVNVLLHAANAVFVWMLLRNLRIPGAWLAGALFAVHPVQVESVAWITERKNVLMGFFFLLALLAWTRFIKEERRGRWRFYALALFLYLLALASKTTACTIPAALLLVLWLQRKTINLARLAQVAPFVILGLGMGLVSIWWERHHQGTQGQLFAIGWGERILLANRAIWFYLEKLVWPNELSFSYPRWPISLANPLGYAWVGGTIAFAALIWFLRRQAGRSLEVAFLFFVATLSPMLGFIMLYTFRYSWTADHYQYLACLGPITLAAAGVELASKKYGSGAKWTLTIGGAVLLFSLGARTWLQAAIYKNEETLWRATLSTNPNSWLAHNNLGLHLAVTGRIEESLPEFERAVDLDPENADGHNNLANTYARLDRRPEAVAEYEKTIALNPRLPQAHANVATLLLKMGRTDEATAHLEQAKALGLRDAALEQLSGAIVARSQKKLETIEDWKHALETDPKNADLQSKIGVALAEAGEPAEALAYLRSAAQLEPQDAGRHYNYATLLSQLGQLTEAIAEYRAALQIRPAYAAAHINLANTLVQSERLEEAIAEYERGLELNPNSFSAHKNLAFALRALGRTAEADAHARRAAELGASPK